MTTERDRYWAALRLIATPPYDDEMFPGCAGCSAVAQSALDGTDMSENVAALLNNPTIEAFVDVAAGAAILLTRVEEAGTHQREAGMLREALERYQQTRERLRGGVDRG